MSHIQTASCLGFNIKNKCQHCRFYLNCGFLVHMGNLVHLQVKRNASDAVKVTASSTFFPVAAVPMANLFSFSLNTCQPNCISTSEPTLDGFLTVLATYPSPAAVVLNVTRLLPSLGMAAASNYESLALLVPQPFKPHHMAASNVVMVVGGAASCRNQSCCCTAMDCDGWH